jgi:hypothetical protein
MQLRQLTLHLQLVTWTRWTAQLVQPPIDASSGSLHQKRASSSSLLNTPPTHSSLDGRHTAGRHPLLLKALQLNYPNPRPRPRTTQDTTVHVSPGQGGAADSTAVMLLPRAASNLAQHLAHLGVCSYGSKHSRSGQPADSDSKSVRATAPLMCPACKAAPRRRAARMASTCTSICNRCLQHM